MISCGELAYDMPIFGIVFFEKYFLIENILK
jgi:hypothetical protein